MPVEETRCYDLEKICKKDVDHLSRGFTMIIPKRNDDPPITGINRIADWVGDIGEYYSCAIQYVTGKDDSSWYEVLVCFINLQSDKELRQKFRTADVVPVLDYKRRFYNYMFQIDNHEINRSDVQIKDRLIIGQFACQIESIAERKARE